MLMRLIDTIKNNLFEILAICVIVIGTTSGVLVTLYEIQIANIKSRYEADLSHKRNECEKRVNQLKKGRESHSFDNIVQKYESKITQITSDYEAKIKQLLSKCSDTAVVTNSKSYFKINGDWDFQVNATSSVDSIGKKRKNSDFIEIRMNLMQKGNNISGKYLWATKNGCSKANANGTINKNEFELIIHYIGICCGGAKMKLKGKIVSSGMIEGSFEPYGIPPNSGCNIWWANITGIKKE